MQDDPRLRTRVVRFLKDQEGVECTLEKIAEGTGLTAQEVRQGVDHNHFVDSLRPNLYYGVIQRVEREGRVTYRFNRAQYLENRTRWINAGGKRRTGRGGDILSNLPKPGLGWLRRKKGGE